MNINYFYYKQERKLTSASRSLYTLAVIIIKFKNTKNDTPTSIILSYTSGQKTPKL